MSVFALDTSGVVPACKPTSDPNILGPCGFHDLDAFTQGYVGELFASLFAELVNKGDFLPNLNGEGASVGIGFSDLAPEALAMILADCVAFCEGLPGLNGDKLHGNLYWTTRQRGDLLDFPPLTVSFGDDGKVHLAVAA